MEKLSLPGTWVFKVFLPAMSTGLLALVFAGWWLDPNSAPGPTILESVGATVFLVVVWLVCLPLKTVVLDGSDLVISNYIYSIRVPVGQVVAVKRHWDGWRTVTITFAVDTDFGRKVRFFPDFYSDAAGKLRALAELA